MFTTVDIRKVTRERVSRSLQKSLAVLIDTQPKDTKWKKKSQFEICKKRTLVFHLYRNREWETFPQTWPTGRNPVSSQSICPRTLMTQPTSTALKEIFSFSHCFPTFTLQDSSQTHQIVQSKMVILMVLVGLLTELYSMSNKTTKSQLRFQGFPFWQKRKAKNLNQDLGKGQGTPSQLGFTLFTKIQVQNTRSLNKKIL